MTIDIRKFILTEPLAVGGSAMTDLGFVVCDSAGKFSSENAGAWGYASYNSRSDEWEILQLGLKTE